MFYNSITPTLSRLFADSVVAAYNTRPAGALIVSPMVHLLSSSPGLITPDTLLATLTANEATFTGYAAAALTLTGPGNIDLRAQGAYGNVTFLATSSGSFVSNNLYGYWIDNGTIVIAAELFQNPSIIPIAKPGDFLDLGLFVPEFCY